LATPILLGKIKVIIAELNEELEFDADNFVIETHMQMKPNDKRNH